MAAEGNALNGVPGVAKRGSRSQGPSFDPSDNRAVNSYLKGLNGKEKEAQEESLNKLSSAQRESVQKFLLVDKVEGGGASPPENAQQPSDVSIQGFNGYSTNDWEYWINAYNHLGNLLWTYYQYQEYEWHYEVDVNVMDYYDYADTNYPLWSFAGTIHKDKDPEGQEPDNTYADTLTHGRMRYCYTQWGCLQEALPLIELRCFSKGGARVQRAERNI